MIAITCASCERELPAARFPLILGPRWADPGEAAQPCKDCRAAKVAASLVGQALTICITAGLGTAVMLLLDVLDVLDDISQAGRDSPSPSHGGPVAGRLRRGRPGASRSRPPAPRPRRLPPLSSPAPDGWKPSERVPPQRGDTPSTAARRRCPRSRSSTCASASHSPVAMPVTPSSTSILTVWRASARSAATLRSRSSRKAWKGCSG